MPAVSIITPILIDTPDKIVWLDEMLQTVLSQTMQDWEVILVDDFSSLLIGEITWKYSDEKRFRWFRTAENSGPAKTRNVAVALAESEAILPLDSDDGFATNTALEKMYDVWQADKTKIVYGNLQWLEIKNGKFEHSKTYMLDPYTFKNAMNLGGIIPVTAMHSVACHNIIGGWKPELEFGREDVEYIINAGKNGFCGQKIDETTLLYRKHKTSRDENLRYGIKMERYVRGQIKEIHADIFSGRFPVGCCGQSNDVGAGSVQSAQSSSMVSATIGNVIITRLPEGKYKDDDTWWIEYYGNKRAQFQIFGVGRRESYVIRGTGHIFQIHKDDKTVFSQRSREYRNAQKLEYLKAPEPEPEPKPQVVVPQSQLVQFKSPEMAVIERLDKIATESRNLNLPMAIKEELPEPTVSEVQLPTGIKPVDSYDLSDLNLGKFEELFRYENITVEWLANEAEVNDLTGFDGIANKRAQGIIDRARSVINS